MTVVEGKYGDYARSKKNTVVSPRLKGINNCMRVQLKGKHYDNVAQVWDAFKSARATCRSASSSGEEIVGRRMSRFRR